MRTEPRRDLDLLFVIDDSPGMADKQNNLASSFLAMINVLWAERGLPNLHLGVVTTDLGTLGTASTTPAPTIGQIGAGGCSGTGDNGNLQTSSSDVYGTFISDIRLDNGSRQTNYVGGIDTVFAQMARVGAGGCEFEQPLGAMRRALANNPANAGFRRPDTLLGVVFVTDEDDCTIKTSSVLGPATAELGPLTSFRCTRFGVTCTNGATPDEMNEPGVKPACKAREDALYIDEIEPYVTFLRELAPDPRDLALGLISGDARPVEVTASSTLAPACMYAGAQTTETAAPAVRLHAFLDAFPDATTRSTICDRDVSSGLVDVALLLARRLGTACLSAPVDLALDQPGAQVDCIVADVLGTTSTPVHACDSDPTLPCWTLETDPLHCVDWKLVLSRAQPPDPATVTTMRCLPPT